MVMQLRDDLLAVFVVRVRLACQHDLERALARDRL